MTSRASTWLHAFVFCLAVSLAAPCHAEGAFGGVDVSLTRYPDYNNVKSGTGWKVFGGHELPWHLIAELDYVDIGKHKISNAPIPLSIGFSGANLSLGGVPFRSDRIGLTTWITAGYYDGKAEATSGNVSIKKNSSGASLDLGVAWNVTPVLALRADFGTLFSVRDFSGQTDDNGKSNVQIVSIGVVLTEPRERVRPGRRPRNDESADQGAGAIGSEPARVEPQPQPAVQAPAPAPAREVPAQSTASPPPSAGAPSMNSLPAEPAPEAKPPPVAPAAAVAAAAPPPAVPPPSVAPQPVAAQPVPAVPAVLAVGGHAKVRAGASVLSRPTLDGAMAKGIAAGAAVNLKSTMNNTTGTWWYVVTPSASGWVRSQDLEPQP